MFRRFFGIIGVVGCMLGGLQAARAEAVYICQSGGKAVFTSFPKQFPKGRCQLSVMQGVTPETAVAASAASDSSDPISELWYELEFGRINPDVKIMPPPPVTTKPAATAPPAASGRPAVPPPAKLTPKQLVERDIALEQQALRHTQQQLAAARRSGQSARAAELARAVADRQQNIRALEQELQRF